MSTNRLSVLLVSRDRTILTQKTIESIMENTKEFSSINIYVFDNLSNLNDDRISIFSNLLKERIIKYYSYDTTDSLTNCFGKAVAFKRWSEMMFDDFEIRKRKNLTLGVSDYYVLIDNDILLGKNWDQYFISASISLETREPMIHFLVKYPGGITNSVSKSKYTFRNQFGKDNFEVLAASHGGGSGFWFMNLKQLRLLKWDTSDLFETFGHFKRHDTTTWKKIKDKFGEARYVAGIVPPNKDNPLVIHLGGVIGSICVSYENSRLNPKLLSDNIEKMNKKEEELKEMSSYEIFERFKNSEAVLNW